MPKPKPAASATASGGTIASFFGRGASGARRSAGHAPAAPTSAPLTQLSFSATAGEGGGGGGGVPADGATSPALPLHGGGGTLRHAVSMYSDGAGGSSSGAGGGAASTRARRPTAPPRLLPSQASAGDSDGDGASSGGGDAHAEDGLGLVSGTQQQRAALVVHRSSTAAQAMPPPHPTSHHHGQGQGGGAAGIAPAPRATPLPRSMTPITPATAVSSGIGGVGVGGLFPGPASIRQHAATTVMAIPIGPAALSARRGRPDSIDGMLSSAPRSAPRGDDGIESTGAAAAVAALSQPAPAVRRFSSAVSAFGGVGAGWRMLPADADGDSQMGPPTARPALLLTFSQAGGGGSAAAGDFAPLPSVRAKPHISVATMTGTTSLATAPAAHGVGGGGGTDIWHGTGASSHAAIGGVAATAARVATTGVGAVPAQPLALPPPPHAADGRQQDIMTKYLNRVPAPNLNPFLPVKTRRARAKERKVMPATAGGRPSQYVRLFEELGVLGSGSFSEVYRVRSRMDGATYAVKRHKEPSRATTSRWHSASRWAGGGDAGGTGHLLRGARANEMKEVHALAALAGCANIMRYHYAWQEDGFLYVQTELAWGSLEDAVRGRRPLAGSLGGMRLTVHMAQLTRSDDGDGVAHSDADEGPSRAALVDATQTADAAGEVDMAPPSHARTGAAAADDGSLDRRLGGTAGRLPDPRFASFAGAALHAGAAAVAPSARGRDAMPRPAAVRRTSSGSNGDGGGGTDGGSSPRKPPVVQFRAKSRSRLSLLGQLPHSQLLPATGDDSNSGAEERFLAARAAYGSASRGSPVSALRRDAPARFDLLADTRDLPPGPTEVSEHDASALAKSLDLDEADSPSPPRQRQQGIDRPLLGRGVQVDPAAGSAASWSRMADAAACEASSVDGRPAASLSNAAARLHKSASVDSGLDDECADLLVPAAAAAVDDGGRGFAQGSGGISLDFDTHAMSAERETPAEAASRAGSHELRPRSLSVDVRAVAAPSRSGSSGGSCIANGGTDGGRLSTMVQPALSARRSTSVASALSSSSGAAAPPQDAETVYVGIGVSLERQHVPGAVAASRAAVASSAPRTIHTVGEGVAHARLSTTAAAVPPGAALRRPPSGPPLALLAAGRSSSVSADGRPSSAGAATSDSDHAGSGAGFGGGYGAIVTPTEGVIASLSSADRRTPSDRGAGGAAPVSVAPRLAFQGRSISGLGGLHGVPAAVPAAVKAALRFSQASAAGSGSGGSSESMRSGALLASASVSRSGSDYGSRGARNDGVADAPASHTELHPLPVPAHRSSPVPQPAPVAGRKRPREANGQLSLLGMLAPAPRAAVAQPGARVEEDGRSDAPLRPLALESSESDGGAGTATQAPTQDGAYEGDDDKVGEEEEIGSPAKRRRVVRLGATATDLTAVPASAALGAQCGAGTSLPGTQLAAIPGASLRDPHVGFVLQPHLAPPLGHASSIDTDISMARTLSSQSGFHAVALGGADSFPVRNRQTQPVALFEDSTSRLGHSGDARQPMDGGGGGGSAGASRFPVGRGGGFGGPAARLQPPPAPSRRLVRASSATFSSADRTTSVLASDSESQPLLLGPIISASQRDAEGDDAMAAAALPDEGLSQMTAFSVAPLGTRHALAAAARDAGGGDIGGDLMRQPRPTRRFRMLEFDLLLVLRHIATALDFMHSRGVAHLDVKPANILVTYEGGAFMCDIDGEWVPEVTALSGIASMDSCIRRLVLESEDRGDNITIADVCGVGAAGASASPVGGLHPSSAARVTGAPAAPPAMGAAGEGGAAALSSVRLRTLGNVVYKLGDLGQVAPITSHSVEEGDCRYLSRELLNGDCSNLPACDVFSLGMSLLELATGWELPAGGDEYQTLRDGDLPAADMAQLSPELQHLLGLMMHPDASVRPTAAELLSHHLVVAIGGAYVVDDAGRVATSGEAAATAAAASATLLDEGGLDDAMLMASQPAQLHHGDATTHYSAARVTVPEVAAAAVGADRIFAVSSLLGSPEAHAPPAEPAGPVHARVAANRGVGGGGSGFPAALRIEVPPAPATHAVAHASAAPTTDSSAPSVLPSPAVPVGRLVLSPHAISDLTRGTPAPPIAHPMPHHATAAGGAVPPPYTADPAAEMLRSGADEAVTTISPVDGPSHLLQTIAHCLASLVGDGGMRAGGEEAEGGTPNLLGSLLHSAFKPQASAASAEASPAISSMLHVSASSASITGALTPSSVCDGGAGAGGQASHVTPIARKAGLAAHLLPQDVTGHGGSAAGNQGTPASATLPHAVRLPISASSDVDHDSGGGGGSRRDGSGLPHSTSLAASDTSQVSLRMSLSIPNLHDKLRLTDTKPAFDVTAAARGRGGGAAVLASDGAGGHFGQVTSGALLAVPMLTPLTAAGAGLRLVHETFRGAAPAATAAGAAAAADGSGHSHGEMAVVPVRLLQHWATTLMQMTLGRTGAGFTDAAPAAGVAAAEEGRGAAR